MNILENIGGRWYTNQKQTNRKKFDNISNVEKSIVRRTKKPRGWRYDWMS